MRMMLYLMLAALFAAFMTYIKLDLSPKADDLRYMWSGFSGIFSLLIFMLAADEAFKDDATAVGILLAACTIGLYPYIPIEIEGVAILMLGIAGAGALARGLHTSKLAAFISYLLVILGSVVTVRYLPFSSGDELDGSILIMLGSWAIVLTILWPAPASGAERAPEPNM